MKVGIAKIRWARSKILSPRKLQRALREIESLPEVEVAIPSNLKNFDFFVKLRTSTRRKLWEAQAKISRIEGVAKCVLDVES